MNIRAIAYVKFLPRANEVWRKVIFSQASVILSRGSLHPWRGVYIQGVGVCIQGVGQTPPQALRSTSGRYASYWNAYLSALLLVAYLHCRKRTRVRTRIRIPISMTTLYYAPHYINSESDPYWLIHIAGSGLGLGFRLQILWLHSIIQNFSHWFRSGSRSLLRCFPKWLLYPF